MKWTCDDNRTIHGNKRAGSDIQLWRQRVEEEGVVSLSTFIFIIHF